MNSKGWRIREPKEVEGGKSQQSQHSKEDTLSWQRSIPRHLLAMVLKETEL